MSRKPTIEFGDVVRLKPFQYIHIHDNNTNVTRVIMGPLTFTRQEHEQILTVPQQFVVIPPRHFCIIENPVCRNAANKEIITDKYGQVVVQLGEREIRFEQEPFPLYPSEVLVGDQITPLKIVTEGKAVKLKATRDFDDRQAGDEWLFEGPGTYIPRIEVEVVSEISAMILKPNTGLLLRARNACTDRSGKRREAGEVWLYEGRGSYLPGIDEEITAVVNATILTDSTALHLEALRTFVDTFGKERKAGEQWIVTSKETEAYLVGPNEKVHGLVPLTVLNTRQFCVVEDPWRDGKQLLGQKEVRRGRCSFFLRPGERLVEGIQNVYLLTAQEALLLSANETFEDEDHNGAKIRRKPGDRWMIYGPLEYVPKVSVIVMGRRTAIPMDENEGIYVRDTKTGQVRAVIGKTYMLAPDEELWAKEISATVLQRLQAQGDAKDWMSLKESKDSASDEPERDASRVVTYRVPHNSIVQVYDFKSKKQRIVFGPEMVKLGPDEEFTVLTLSGSKPKKAGLISTLAVCLGPDFMTDIIVVETSDHARLSLQLSYSWYFDVKYGDEHAAQAIFSVADFVGDACSAIASRIRGAVAAEPFDVFHKNSSTIIKAAVCGIDKVTKEPKEKLVFKNNHLVITSVDIQSVEPVDAKTRDALMKSVQLAIEITTKSQEAAARHDAERREQIARGELDRQVISDKASAEKERLNLLDLQAQSAAIESTGTSTAEAKALAASAEIEGSTQVSIARLKAQAVKFLNEAELYSSTEKRKLELAFTQELNALEVAKAKELSEIQGKALQSNVEALGRATIAAMARAGPELQARLLKGLGLQGYLLTDGCTPINLMNTASALTAGPNANANANTFLLAQAQAQQKN